MAGLGVAVILRALPRPRDFSRGMVLVMLGLVVLGIGSVARDRASPYRTDYEHHAREFARWFWKEKSRDAELACARSEYGVIEPGTQHYNAALYICYREICRPRPPEDGPRLGAVTGDHPLRCVIFDEFPLANPAFVALKDRISSRSRCGRSSGSSSSRRQSPIAMSSRSSNSRPDCSSWADHYPRNALAFDRVEARFRAETVLLISPLEELGE